MLVGADWPAEGPIGHLNTARKDAEQIAAEVEQAINQGAAAIEACRALIRWNNRDLGKNGLEHALTLALLSQSNLAPAGQTQGPPAYLPEPDANGVYTYPDGAGIAPRGTTVRKRWVAWWANKAMLTGVEEHGDGQEAVWYFKTPQEAAEALADGAEGPARKVT
jgi:hypothetical protein